MNHVGRSAQERTRPRFACCAIRRSARTSIQWCRPNSATGATSRARGAKGAVLFDQSHHMAEITIQGPDALQLCSYATINSFANFVPGKAKQMSGQSRRLRDRRWHPVLPGQGRAALRGPRSHGELAAVSRREGGFDVEVIRDDRSPSQPNGNARSRDVITATRSRVPRATQVLEKLKVARCRKSASSTFDGCIKGGRSAHCATEWRASRASNLGSV